MILKNICEIKVISFVKKNYLNLMKIGVCVPETLDEYSYYKYDIINRKISK